MLSGATAAVDSELDALVFTPAASQPNTQVQTTLGLSVLSNTGYSVADDSTVVTDVVPAVAPTITGAAAGQTTTSEAALSPFAGVTIGDANSGDPTETLTITLAGAGGALTDGTGFHGLAGSGSTYTLIGTAAAVTSELDALSFTPTAGLSNTTSTTRFTLSDTSSVFATPTTDTTKTVTDKDPAVAPVVSGAIAGQVFGVSSPDKPFS